MEQNRMVKSVFKSDDVNERRREFRRLWRRVIAEAVSRK